MANVNNETVSNVDFIEISKKFLKSLFVELPLPSAILVEIEADALLSCEIKPKVSVLGNVSAISYILFAYSIDSFHISRFSNLKAILSFVI